MFIFPCFLGLTVCKNKCIVLYKIKKIVFNALYQHECIHPVFFSKVNICIPVDIKYKFSLGRLYITIITEPQNLSVHTQAYKQTCLTKSTALIKPNQA